MSDESANTASVAVCIADRGSWDRHPLIRLSLVSHSLGLGDRRDRL